MGRRCILELEDYSFERRARLLYNHLYFSDLPQEYRDVLLKDDLFLDIIKHAHFNPRVIEWLSTYSRSAHVAVEGYRTHVLSLLTSPEGIWDHAFRSQISNAARHVLLSFNTVGEWTAITDLEPAFIALHRLCAAKYNERIGPGDFRRALQELDGGFLTCNATQLSYLNPSVREFVASVILDERETAEDLINSAVRFKQLVNIWKLARTRPGSELWALTLNTELLGRALLRVLDGPSTRWEKSVRGGLVGYPIDSSLEIRLAFLADVAAILESRQLAEMALRVADNLTREWEHEVVDFTSVLRLLGSIGKNRWFLEHGGEDVYRNLRLGLLDGLEFARADDWLDLLAVPPNVLEWDDAEELRLQTALRVFEVKGARDERSDCSTLDELSSLRDSFARLCNEYGLDLRTQVGQLDEDITEREEQAENRDNSDEYLRERAVVRPAVFTEDDVREMFRTLSEG
ncbi:MAG: hypothetical protein WC538_21660 [Thermoanaerobaculia bacterium]|jgi:hypothetical protein